MHDLVHTCVLLLLLRYLGSSRVSAATPARRAAVISQVTTKWSCVAVQLQDKVALVQGFSSMDEVAKQMAIDLARLRAELE